MTRAEFESNILKENPMALREHSLLTSPRTSLLPPSLQAAFLSFSCQWTILKTSLSSLPVKIWPQLGLEVLISPSSACLSPSSPWYHISKSMAGGHRLPPSHSSLGDSQKERPCLHLHCYWNLVNLLAWSGALAIFICSPYLVVRQGHWNTLLIVLP